MSLKNARVLVIGGTSGIGLGVASAAADRGAIPIVVSRRQPSVDRALAQLPDHARGATVDLSAGGVAESAGATITAAALQAVEAEADQMGCIPIEQVDGGMRAAIRAAAKGRL